MLKLNNLTLAYHESHPILSVINLDLGEGEKIGILGRNGIGKTTLLNSIFGLVPIIRGEISFMGRSILQVSAHRLSGMGVGYFMQGAPVYPHMSVRENLWMVSGRISRDEFNRRRDELLSGFPIFTSSSFDNMPAGSLSGGERSQLAMAMAIFNKPSLLLLDEPFAGLSPVNIGQFMNSLRDYHSMSGAAIIMAEQDAGIASDLCDRLLVIRDNKLIHML